MLDPPLAGPFSATFDPSSSREVDPDADQFAPSSVRFMSSSTQVLGNGRMRAWHDAASVPASADEAASTTSASFGGRACSDRSSRSFGNSGVSEVTSMDASPADASVRHDVAAEQNP